MIRMYIEVCALVLYLKYMSYESIYCILDVKPGNTLMNSEGLVKLSDFGISRQLIGTTELSNTYVGTIRFMSPERLLGDGYNYSGDIWSVGVMMMELWTKTCPFKGSMASPLKLLEEIENSQVPSTRLKFIIVMSCWNSFYTLLLCRIF